MKLFAFALLSVLSVVAAGPPKPVPASTVETFSWKTHDKLPKGSGEDQEFSKDLLGKQLSSAALGAIACGGVESSNQELKDLVSDKALHTFYDNVAKRLELKDQQKEEILLQVLELATSFGRLDASFHIYVAELGDESSKALNTDVKVDNKLANGLANSDKAKKQIDDALNADFRNLIVEVFGNIRSHVKKCFGEAKHTVRVALETSSIMQTFAYLLEASDSAEYSNETPIKLVIVAAGPVKKMVTEDIDQIRLKGALSIATFEKCIKSAGKALNDGFHVAAQNALTKAGLTEITL